METRPCGSETEWWVEGVYGDKMEMSDIASRITSLKIKAAAIQAAVDSCDGHLWQADYMSEIKGTYGSSAVCVRCGERRGWNDIGPKEKWRYDR